MANRWRAAAKPMAARTIEMAFAMLPPGAHRLMIKDLIGRLDRYDQALTLGALARALGIERLVATGEYGEVTSSCDDAVVLPSYARAKSWSPRTNAALAACLAEGGAYLDIGANIGLTTLPIARNPRVRCYAFEPEPTNFANLQRNIANNCAHGNVTAHAMALGDRNGAVAFELASDGNLGDHRLRGAEASPAAGAPARTIEVECRRLDDWLEAPPAPLAAKIDTQGAEPFVVAGGARTLGAAALLVLEFWPYGMARLGADPAPLLAFLAENFRSAELVSAEGDFVLEDQPMAALCCTLAEFAEKDRAEPEIYWDVYARKA